MYLSIIIISPYKLLFVSCSTCFGPPCAHLQELTILWYFTSREKMKWILCSKLFNRQHKKQPFNFLYSQPHDADTHTVQGHTLHTDWPQYALNCSTGSTQKQPFNFLYSQPHDADTHTQYSTRPQAAHWLTTICSKLFNRQHTKTAI